MSATKSRAPAGTSRSKLRSNASVDRYAARGDGEIGTPNAHVTPIARSTARAHSLIAARAAVENWPAAVAPGDPLAVAPHDDRPHETLMLKAACRSARQRGT